jgi:predicted alpha-1,2-mannosidase
MSGTAASTTFSAIKHSEGGTESLANTIPAVTLPFAMTQWVPQTRLTEKKCQAPYYYKDSLLTGFRATHWISGSCMQDYGSFTVMAITGNLKTNPAEFAATFNHKNEISTPAYYKVNLEKYNLDVEMTSTARCGIMRFTSCVDDSLYILITPNSDQGKGSVNIDNNTGEISGNNPVHRIYQGWGTEAGFSGYAFASVNKTSGVNGTFAGSEVFIASSIQAKKDIGAFIGFKVKKGECIIVRIGTSFSSIEGARKNLLAEIPAPDFDLVKTKAEQEWEQALGKIQVQTMDEKNKRIFYTAFYHTMQQPRLYNDVDKTYPRFAGQHQLMKLTKGNYYDDYSMWDIYRAELPLYEILKPSLANDLAQSLVLKGEQGGWLPIFPCWNSYTAAMVGDHCTPFISSTILKGIYTGDKQNAYSLMRKNAFEVAGAADYNNGKGRRALASYLQYGYIPMEDSVQEAFHKKEQVSRTLEYAYDDYTLALVAKQLGKQNDFLQLKKRSFNYRNVFDTTVGMVRGRYSNGNWYAPFVADKRQSYITEGTPRQYTFYVPQNVPELAKLMGGREHLELALDSLFDKDEYWHGNEPGHQIPFMYNFTAAPWKTQKRVRSILEDEYSDGPGGLSGNDDAGQMSAWYVFGAAGFYPLDPTAGTFMICSPLFDNVTFKLENGKTFTIKCKKQSDNSIYISNVRFNGKPFSRNYLQYADIVKGGVLEIVLDEKPSQWGSNVNEQPKSMK